MRGRAGEPVCGFLIVLRHAAARFIHQAEVVFRFAQALIGGFAIPADGFALVRSYAAALLVGDSEAVLRPGGTLLGSLAQILERLHEILGGAAEGDLAVPATANLLTGQRLRPVLP